MSTTTPRRRSSISDVARKAGVSVGTVSNVLNRPDRVSPTTRERVEDAISELQFVPNGSARQLRAGTITTVGAIVLDIGNPFFTEVARGIEDRLAEDDYTLMLASSDEDPDREARYLKLFEEHGVQGVLVVPSGDDIEPLLELRARGVNVVLLDATSPVPDISSAAVNDVVGGQLAGSHLIAEGHTRIAFINGVHTIRQCGDRYAGMLRAFDSAGLDASTDLVEVTAASLNADGGEAAMTHLLATTTAGVDRPTAVFCVNDLVALGVQRTLRRAGIDMPGEMAVVGYDDVNFAGELAIPLTSVRQPTHQLGYRAADLLLTEHQQGERFRPEQVQFQPELVVRASSSASAGSSGSSSGNPSGSSPTSAG
ncbi:LacI family DNA-binding transcriptional regulator [Sanguibacter suarezii]|uniref:LacI family DNA-binding transcriptional regulator n=1 Tax=Sanguibacter suarezii TaxID=60921 RepID=UPI000834E62F|nr:LacI family DNA-binding transcriptional regulator [Sanguibacter suarezii]